jgi:hypothetical protein
VDRASPPASSRAAEHPAIMHAAAAAHRANERRMAVGLSRAGAGNRGLLTFTRSTGGPDADGDNLGEGFSLKPL